MSISNALSKQRFSHKIAEILIFGADTQNLQSTHLPVREAYLSVMGLYSNAFFNSRSRSETLTWLLLARTALSWKKVLIAFILATEREYFPFHIDWWMIWIQCCLCFSFPGSRDVKSMSESGRGIAPFSNWSRYGCKTRQNLSTSIVVHMGSRNPFK